jgi:hypothetical protein
MHIMYVLAQEFTQRTSRLKIKVKQDRIAQQFKQMQPLTILWCHYHAVKETPDGLGTAHHSNLSRDLQRNKCFVVSLTFYISLYMVYHT